MVQLLALIDRIVGHMGAQLLEHILVHLTEDDRGVDFRALQMVQILHGQIGGGVGGGAHTQGDEHFIGVQTGVPVAQMLHLQVGDGLQHRGGDQLHLIGDAGQILQAVQQGSAAGTHELGGLAGDDPAALAQNYGRAWAALGNLFPLLENAFVIKKRNLEVECDFLADKTTIIVRADLSITVGRIILLLLIRGVPMLREFMKLLKLRKGGAKA